jgi:hypothetical protein
MSSGEDVAKNVIDAERQMAAPVPRFNVERAAGKVVADFRAALPAAAVYVHDNNSTDKAFGSFGIALAIVSIGLAIPIFVTYMRDGLVPRFPTAILPAGLMLPAFLFIAVGLILDTVTRGRRELKLLAYLALRAPGDERRRS